MPAPRFEGPTTESYPLRSPVPFASRESKPASGSVRIYSELCLRIQRTSIVQFMSMVRRGGGSGYPQRHTLARLCIRRLWLLRLALRSSPYSSYLGQEHYQHSQPSPTRVTDLGMSA